MSNTRQTLAEQGFLRIAFSRQVFPRALRVALIVGTILAFINHGDKLISFSLVSMDVLKVVLTYFVPYSVSTWSSVKAMRKT